MTTGCEIKPLGSPRKDGPFGYYVLRGKDGSGPNLQIEVRHFDPPPSDEDEAKPDGE